MKDFIFEYEFSAVVWKYDGEGAWYFASVPVKQSKNIRQIHQESEEGWGRLKSEIIINKSNWKTSIWFDTRLNRYIVPIKFVIRKKEQIKEGSKVNIKLKIKMI